ncbi:CocE/NonD family hydrolase [Arthrobacter russicus]|uniref:CocE/NonD family hydrolase n=1 Tax=Arthrobacter russicus TaxID=172040 RepID=UPI00286D663F|nr:CocE/NonD family hydrolase [Arthrobacter russicus]
MKSTHHFRRRFAAAATLTALVFTGLPLTAFAMTDAPPAQPDATQSSSQASPSAPSEIAPSSTPSSSSTPTSSTPPSSSAEATAPPSATPTGEPSSTPSQNPDPAEATPTPSSPATGTASAAAVQQPEFADGMAQPVYQGKDLITEELWIPTPVDTDGDGQNERLRATVYRPKDTQNGLKVPTVIRMSPYNAGANNTLVHDMKRELWDPSKPIPKPTFGTVPSSGWFNTGARRNYPFYTDRGFAFVSIDSIGTNGSTGCTQMLNAKEAESTKAAVDWVTGRISGLDLQGNSVTTDWSSGKVGMWGISYLGSQAILASTTGVAGLDAIVPMSPLSNFYDYYRVGGAVVEPTGYNGEDLDNYVKLVSTNRPNEQSCQATSQEFLDQQDRATGQYSDFWNERNFFANIGKVTTPTLISAGLKDWNVRNDQTTKWFLALKERGVPTKLLLHQQDHVDPATVAGSEWTNMLNKWFTRYLFNVQNGVENAPDLRIQREDGSWQNEPSWPAVGSAPAAFRPLSGGNGSGGLVLADAPKPGIESLSDDGSITSGTLASTPNSQNRLLYATAPAKSAVRLSGFANANLALSFSRPAANISLQILDRAPDGTATVVTRGWADPQNRNSLTSSETVVPGTEYQIDIPFISTDYVFKAGNQLEIMLFASDAESNVLPPAGTVLSANLGRSQFSLPLVGGTVAGKAAFGDGNTEVTPPVTKPDPEKVTDPRIVDSGQPGENTEAGAETVVNPAASNLQRLPDTGTPSGIWALLGLAAVAVLGGGFAVLGSSLRRRNG